MSSEDSRNIQWPQNTILSLQDIMAYRKEMYAQYNKSDIYKTDPSTPDPDQLVQLYCRTKDLDLTDIDDDLAEILATDDDLSGVIILSAIAKEIRGTILQTMIKKFTTWRQIPIKEIRYQLYRGWVNLDTGWISDKSSAKFSHSRLCICSDSQVIFEAYVRNISQYHANIFINYFQFVHQYTSDWQQCIPDSAPTNTKLYNKQSKIFYCVDNGYVLSYKVLRYKDDDFKIGSNIKELFDLYRGKLQVDFPLGVHTIDTTKNLSLIFCAPQCKKAQYYDLDNNRRVNHPTKNVHLHRQYRIFSKDEEYVRSVVKFYRRHWIHNKNFKCKLHPILYQYFTVLFLYAKN